MEIQPTDWFALDKYTPVRDGWYEVQLVSGDTAFAKFGGGDWTEKPSLVFTHWRGLSADPAKSGETETIGAKATLAEGIRDVMNVFFPGRGDEAHQPREDSEHGKGS